MVGPEQNSLSYNRKFRIYGLYFGYYGPSTILSSPLFSSFLAADPNSNLVTIATFMWNELLMQSCFSYSQNFFRNLRTRMQVGWRHKQDLPRPRLSHTHHRRLYHGYKCLVAERKENFVRLAKLARCCSLYLVYRVTHLVDSNHP